MEIENKRKRTEESDLSVSVDKKQIAPLTEVEIDLDLVDSQWGVFPRFKYCKKCENYRPLVHFKGKRHFVEGKKKGVHVSECVRCRDTHARYNRRRREEKPKISVPSVPWMRLLARPGGTGEETADVGHELETT